MQQNPIQRVLSIRPFLYLWLAELFSQIATNMLNFILIIAVFNLTGSNTAVSGIILTFTVPAILFGLLAGVYVDRMNKKKVLLYTNVIRAFLLVILAIFYNQLAFIYMLSFLGFVVTQFFIPAEIPTISLFVPKDVLLQANALFGIAIYVSILIAYALSSPFFIIFGQQKVYMVLAVFFFIASLCIIFVKLPKQNLNQLKRITVKEELKITISLISKNKEIFHSMLLLVFFQVLILIIASIGPGYAKEVLHIPVDRFPLLLVTPAALGMVLGALIVGHYLHNFKKDNIATVGIFVIGISAFLLPFGANVESKHFVQAINGFLPHMFDITVIHFMIFLAFILGLGGAFIFVPSNTTLQEKTSEVFRGKLYGFLNSLTGLLSLLPVIAVGGLADTLGVATVLKGLGVVIFLLGFLRLTIL